MKEILNFNHRTEVEILLSSMTCTFLYIFIQSWSRAYRQQDATSTITLSSLKLPRFHRNCLERSMLTTLAQIFLNFDFKWFFWKGDTFEGPQQVQ